MPIFEDLDDLCRAAGEHIAAAVDHALGQRELATLVLTGGRTAEHLHAVLKADPVRKRIDWCRLHVFWGDERSVPPDHPDSNYRMARTTLLAGVPIPDANVHRIKGELPSAEAAMAYEREIRQVLGDDSPLFDVVLLSMGEDGHVASLFPRAAELAERHRLVVPVIGPKPPPKRVSLTLRALDAARNVFVLAAGRSKAAAVAQVCVGDASLDLPVSLLHPDHGTVTWLVDREAASECNDQMTASG